METEGTHPEAAEVIIGVKRWSLEVAYTTGSGEKQFDSRCALARETWPE